MEPNVEMNAVVVNRENHSLEYLCRLFCKPVRLTHIFMALICWKADLAGKSIGF